MNGVIVIGNKPRRPPVGQIRTSGRFWTVDGATFRPRFVSGFTLCTKPRDQVRQFLDWAAASGFNGVRVLAGALTWAGQTPESARAGLPMVIEEAASRGLYLEVTCNTDSATGYDVISHTYAISRSLPPVGVLVEGANEYWHPTQSDLVHDLSNLTRLGGYFADPYAEGAPDHDEPVLASHPFQGEWISLHLDRGRDKWNMVRRVRELENVSNIYGRPVQNNEPIGWDEADQPARRCADPAVAYCMGALSRGFEVGLVSHAQHGLRADLPGPIQQECHNALVRGWATLGTDARLTFKNATWADSPVGNADFSKVVRAYSFITGNRGWTVLVGLTGNPSIRWANGWSPTGSPIGYPACQIQEIKR